MFSLKKINNLIDNFNYENCIFSANESRPSKSVIDCNKYKEYIKLNLNLEILNEFSYLNYQTKPMEYFLLRELINIFKLNYSENDNISLSFDSIIINENYGEHKKNNLIFCLENQPTIKNILSNLLQVIKEINNEDNLIINYIHLFTYPAVELLVIILNMFDKIKVYYCKILKQNILYCINYKHNSNIIIFLKNIINKYKISNIRQFGIYIDTTNLNLIKQYNIFILDYYLNLNRNIVHSSLEDKEFFFKHYCKKYSKMNTNTFECNHSIKEFNLQNCHIYIKFYDLFCIH